MSGIIFAVTIVFIILSTVIAAFVRRTSRDKCLKDFSDNMVTLEDAAGRTVWGKLRVENTGLEFVYNTPNKDEDGHFETSFILYKHEYPNMTVLLRFHDQLSYANKKIRQKKLKQTYHPSMLRRLKRKILNIFKTIRDSAMEVINLAISYAKKTSVAGSVLTSQDKYVSQMKQKLIGSVGTSYEPLLERYIGHKVVLELIRNDKIFEYCGVLKDYTANFIEIMDVDYTSQTGSEPRKADLVVPRKSGIIRHFAE